MIVVPATPGPVATDWRQVDYGGNLTPPLGGPVQRVNRLGNRLAVTVTLPPMTPAQAGAWVMALNRAVREGARWAIRQVEQTIGPIGTPVVDGAGQAGATLVIRSAQPGGTLFESQFLTIVTAAARYTHMASAAIVGTDGKVSLSIVPPLRAEPANGDQVLIAGPTIDGLLEGDGVAWTVDRARRFGLSFTIVEQD